MPAPPYSSVHGDPEHAEIAHLAPQIGREVVAAVDLGRARRDLVVRRTPPRCCAACRPLSPRSKLSERRSVRKGCGHRRFPLVLLRNYIGGERHDHQPGHQLRAWRHRHAVARRDDRPEPRPHRRALPGQRWRWSCAARACAGPIASWSSGRRRSPPGCWRSGSSAATGSASGRSTTPNGWSTQFATAKAGLILVNINPAYRLPSWNSRSNKVGCKALITATRFKTSDYIGLLDAARAGTRRPASPARSAAARLPHLRTVIQIGGTSPGTYRLRRRAGAGHRPSTAPSSPACRPTLQFDDVINIQFTSRHHRQPEGRRADPPQHPQQRLLHRRGDAADRAGQALHPGAALPLLRHGARQPRLHHAWRDDGLSRRRLRPAGDAADRGRGALHRAARRADHVHRRAGASRSSTRFDLSQPADRHHGRLALPDRGDAPRRRAG